MKINILFNVASMNHGGIETYLMNIIRNIDQSKFRIYFLCYGTNTFIYENEILALNGIILRTERPEKIRIVKHILDISKILKDNNIIIIHNHLYLSSIYGLIAAKRAGVKVRITHSHSSRREENSCFIRKLYAQIAKYIIKKNSTERIACSVNAGVALFGKSEYKVAKNGIDTNNYLLNQNSRTKSRKSLNILSSQKVLINAARFEEVKNHTFLINIFCKYLKIDANAILILAGEGPLQNEIKKQVIMLGIDKSVLFIGSRSDIKVIYDAADVFVMPSHSEGLGIAVIEAQINGLPCVVSTGVPNEVNISNEISFLPLTDHDDTWIHNIKLAHRTEHKVASEPYDIKCTIKQLESIYLTALGVGA